MLQTLAAVLCALPGPVYGPALEFIAFSTFFALDNVKYYNAELLGSKGENHEGSVSA